MNPTSVIVTSGNEIGEWARKIIEVYMTWYTFFAGSNILALGWIFGSKVDATVSPMLKPICVLFGILNLLGAASTVAVGWNVGPKIPEFEKLIFWAAGANGLALAGFTVVWLICFYKLWKAVPAVVPAPPLAGTIININSAGTVINT